MNEYEIQEPKKTRTNIALLIAGLALAVGLVALAYYQTKINQSTTSDSRPANIIVAKGQSSRAIANLLSEKKVISSPNIFVIYAYLNHASGKIQAGEYSLDSNMPITEIVDVLTNGKVVSDARKVTIIEGKTNSQIGDYLGSRGIIKSETEFSQFLSTANFDFKFSEAAKKFNYQGFLFPDTYTLTKDEPIPDLVSKMLNNFENKFTEKMETDITNNRRTVEDVLILASIVEKEVGRNKENLTDEDLSTMQKERELVASVFYNRIEVGMALESDATVNYITGKADRSVTIADTKIKSPYNTYQNRGLPPTPISNPGIGSIMAAIYPASTDYVYFLNSPEGTAYFARTLAEHNENRVKYLR